MLITYVPAPGYTTNERGILNAGDGSAFDVFAALQSGGGQITIDTNITPSLARALDSFPGLVRSGSTPGTPVAVDTIGPVMAHSAGAAPGDMLIRGQDGLFAPAQKIGQSNLSQAVQANFATPVPRIDIAGHSIPAAGGATGGDQNGYPERLAKALGATKRANISNGGAIACWPTGAGHDGGHSWVLNTFRPPALTEGNANYLPHTALAVVHFGQNDIAMQGSQAPKPWLEAMRTIASRYCMAGWWPDTDPAWTWGSAMQITSNGWSWGDGTTHFVQIAGTPAVPNPATQFGTYTVPSDYPGNLVIGVVVGVIAGVTALTMTVAITIDGVEYDYVLNYGPGGHGDGENGKSNEIVLRLGRNDCGLGLPVNQGGLGIPALSAGAHTITVAPKSVVGAGNPYFVIVGAGIEADPLDGPVLVFPSLYRCSSAANGGYALWATGWTHGPAAGTDPLNDASIAAWNVQLQTLLADFPGRSIYVDIDTPMGKNPALVVGDGAHPTNRGHGVIASTITQAVAASGLLTPRVRSAPQSGRFTDGYDGGRWRPIGGAYGTSIGTAFSNSWVASAVSTGLPSYHKDMAGRVFLRGACASGTAPGAGIANLSNAVGYSPPNFVDRATLIYNGATSVVGFLRADPTTGLFMSLNGVNAGASHFNELSGVDYQADK